MAHGTDNGTDNGTERGRSFFIRAECDSGLDSIESPGILTIIDGPEHDELSQVYSHLSSYHVGSHVPAYP